MAASPDQSVPGRGALVLATIEQLEGLVRRAVEQALADLGETTSAPALVDRQGLARALGVSVGTVDKLRAEGAIPEIKIGDSPRFEVGRVIENLRERGRT